MRSTIRFSLLPAFVFLTAPLHLIADARTNSAIERTAETYRKGVIAGDIATVVATYRDDAVEMPPNRVPLKGRAEIEQYYRRLFAGPMKIMDFTFADMKIVTSSDLGYVTGSYKQKLVAKSGEPVEDSGNFVVVVRRGATTWKSACVIYNTDHPPAITGASVPIVIPLFPAFRNTVALVAIWLRIVGWTVLGSVSFGVVVWLIYALRKRRLGRTIEPFYASESRWTVSGENAGVQIATYSQPSGYGVE